MNITCHYSNNPPFILNDHEKHGLGGTENYAVNVAVQLNKLKHNVSFYNMQPLEKPIIVGGYENSGIQWGNIKDFDPDQPGDVLISFRMREVFHRPLANCHKVLILADTESVGLGEDVRAGLIDSVVAVSKWQMNKIAKEEGLEGHPCWILSSNGINISDFDNITFKKDYEFPNCIHLSTPERGAGLLLELWPEIVERVRTLSNSTVEPFLYLLSSYRGWGVSYEQNEEMCKDLYDKAKSLFNEYNVINLKHVNSSTLKRYQLNSKVMLYPTNFKETYCISLTECMYAGAIPIVSNVGAMAERVDSGITGYLVGDYESDAYSEECREEFVDIAAQVLVSTTDELMEYARGVASTQDYSVVIPALMKEIESRL